MTPAEIRAKAEELAALLEKATPGPWEPHCGHLVRAVHGDEAVPIAEMRGPYRHRVGVVRGHYEQEANLALIVAAVNALPALLAEVETLTAALLAARAEALREAAEVARDYRGCRHRGCHIHVSMQIAALATNQEPADE